MINNFAQNSMTMAAMRWDGNNELAIRRFCGCNTEVGFGSTIEIKAPTSIICGLFDYVCMDRQKIWVERLPKVIMNNGEKDEVQ